MLLKSYFCCAVPTSVKMSEEDLRCLSALVSEVKLLRATDGRRYCYFFPCDDRKVDSIQQMLAKYKIFGTKHISRYDWCNREVVRVRYRTQEQSVTIKNFAEDVMKMKSVLEDMNTLSR